MGEGSVVVGIGSGADQRDAFLGDALRRGARAALWMDVGRGWAEAYEAPVEGRVEGPAQALVEGPRRAAPATAVGPEPPRSFGRRALVWPGEVRVLCAATDDLRHGPTGE